MATAYEPRQYHDPSALNHDSDDHPERDMHVGPRTTEGQNPAIDEAVSKLDRAVTDLLDSDNFRLYLQYKGAMHNYSWLNMLLIYMDYQDRGLSGPIATMGYKGWLNQGRKVKPGSKAIALFKPVLKFWRDYDITNPIPSGSKYDSKSQRYYLLKSRAVGFEIIRKTFHIQDTDGPDYDVPAPVTLEDDSDAARSVLKSLLNGAKGIGVSNVAFKDLEGSAHGYYLPSDRTICLDCKDSPAQQAKTLVHEYAHHVCCTLNLDHHEFYQQTRDAAESVVEGAAFIVMASFGIDTTQYSAPYIARWGADLNKIRTLLRDMDKVARVIIEKLPRGAKNDGNT